MDSEFIVEFLVGSFSHVIALVPVLFEIWWSKDCTGISAKTQILHAIVQFTKAALSPDGSRVFVSWLSISAVISIYCHRKPEHKKYDNFRLERLILPCLVIAGFIRHDSTSYDFFVMFATYLETLAIIPQTQIITRSNHFVPIMYYYVGVLCVSKLYHVFVLTMKYMEENSIDKLVVCASLVQLLLYVDFFGTHIRYIGEIEKEAVDEEARILRGEIEKVMNGVKSEEVKMDGGNGEKKDDDDGELKEVKSEGGVEKESLPEDKKAQVVTPD